MKKLLIICTALIFVFTSLFLVFADRKSPENVSASSAITTPSDWAKGDVENALKLGILNANKTYYYGSFITREAFCETIYNLIDKTNTADSLVSYKNEYNVSDTDNFYVKYLVENKIINGKENTKSNVKFYPDDFLTREETAEIIKRLIFKIGCDIVYTDESIEYDDDKDISKWAIGGIQFVSKTGLMNGYNKVFYPKAYLSTEEAVTVVMRAFEFIKNNITVNKNATFADKINAQMPKNENYMFSPLSIKMALAMAANGANGKTKKEILNALKIENLDEYNSFVKNLMVLYTKTDKLQINIANSIWLNESNADGDFKDAFKSTISDFYNGDSRSVNNSNAVDEINGWVNENTKGKISTIRNDAEFWVSLINVVYFKGLWQNEFNEYMTKDDTFINADGSKSRVPFMNKTFWVQYAKTDNIKVITLPYKNNFYIDKGNGIYESENYNDINANMHIIISDKDISIEKELKNMKSENTYVNLSLPKFSFEYNANINKFLKNIGICKAFTSENADFSHMFTGSNMWIDSVIHKTFISVDEKGTEAAAITEVGMAGSSLPPKPIEIKFDRPFYFVIEVNGEILFMGRYAYAE